MACTHLTFIITLFLCAAASAQFPELRAGNTASATRLLTVPSTAKDTNQTTDERNDNVSAHKKGGMGTPCINDKDCSAAMGLVCTSSEGYLTSRCGCDREKPIFMNGSEGASKCVKPRSLRESCISDSECDFHSQSRKCINAVCKCKPPYVERDNQDCALRNPLGPEFLPVLVASVILLLALLVFAAAYRFRRPSQLTKEGETLRSPTSSVHGSSEAIPVEGGHSAAPSHSTKPPSTTPRHLSSTATNQHTNKISILDASEVHHSCIDTETDSINALLQGSDRFSEDLRKNVNKMPGPIAAIHRPREYPLKLVHAEEKVTVHIPHGRDMVPNDSVNSIGELANVSGLKQSVEVKKARPLPKEKQEGKECGHGAHVRDCVIHMGEEPDSTAGRNSNRPPLRDIHLLCAYENEKGETILKELSDHSFIVEAMKRMGEKSRKSERGEDTTTSSDDQPTSSLATKSTNGPYSPFASRRHASGSTNTRDDVKSTETFSKVEQIYNRDLIARKAGQEDVTLSNSTGESQVLFSNANGTDTQEKHSRREVIETSPKGLSHPRKLPRSVSSPDRLYSATTRFPTLTSPATTQREITPPPKSREMEARHSNKNMPRDTAREKTGNIECCGENDHAPLPSAGFNVESTHEGGRTEGSDSNHHKFIANMKPHTVYQLLQRTEEREGDVIEARRANDDIEQPAPKIGGQFVEDAMQKQGWSKGTDANVLPEKSEHSEQKGNFAAEADTTGQAAPQTGVPEKAVEQTSFHAARHPLVPNSDAGSKSSGVPTTIPPVSSASTDTRRTEMNAYGVPGPFTSPLSSSLNDNRPTREPPDTSDAQTASPALSSRHEITTRQVVKLEKALSRTRKPRASQSRALRKTQSFGLTQTTQNVSTEGPSEKKQDGSNPMTSESKIKNVILRGGENEALEIKTDCDKEILLASGTEGKASQIVHETRTIEEKIPRTSERGGQIPQVQNEKTTLKRKKAAKRTVSKSSSSHMGLAEHAEPKAQEYTALTEGAERDQLVDQAPPKGSLSHVSPAGHAKSEVPQEGTVTSVTQMATEVSSTQQESQSSSTDASHPTVGGIPRIYADKTNAQESSSTERQESQSSSHDDVGSTTSTSSKSHVNTESNAQEILDTAQQSSSHDVAKSAIEASSGARIDSNDKTQSERKENESRYKQDTTKQNPQTSSSNSLANEDESLDKQVPENLPDIHKADTQHAPVQEIPATDDIAAYSKAKTKTVAPVRVTPEQDIVCATTNDAVGQRYTEDPTQSVHKENVRELSIETPRTALINLISETDDPFLRSSVLTMMTTENSSEQPTALEDCSLPWNVLCPPGKPFHPPKPDGLPKPDFLSGLDIMSRQRHLSEESSSSAVNNASHYPSAAKGVLHERPATTVTATRKEVSEQNSPGAPVHTFEPCPSTSRSPGKELHSDATNRKIKRCDIARVIMMGNEHYLRERYSMPQESRPASTVLDETQYIVGCITDRGASHQTPDQPGKPSPSLTQSPSPGLSAAPRSTTPSAASLTPHEKPTKHGIREEFVEIVYDIQLNNEVVTDALRSINLDNKVEKPNNVGGDVTNIHRDERRESIKGVGDSESRVDRLPPSLRRLKHDMDNSQLEAAAALSTAGSSYEMTKRGAARGRSTMFYARRVRGVGQYTKSKCSHCNRWCRQRLDNPTPFLHNNRTDKTKSNARKIFTSRKNTGAAAPLSTAILEENQQVASHQRNYEAELSQVKGNESGYSATPRLQHHDWIFASGTHEEHHENEGYKEQTCSDDET
ncbi:uncharacterized protein LOC135394536 isoform X2 [Ornithodoros turicata]|uniref:uncharacterized protein LOC135394536 isoform X2 n=1 Tax=Ornithodoros turicata TaxID=34597 RepID=UPI003139B6FD